MTEEAAENVQMQTETGQVSEESQPIDSDASQTNQTNEASSAQNTAARNFAEMRKKNEELKRKNEEAMQIIRNIEAQKQQQQQQTQEEHVSEIKLGDDDDLVEVKTVKAILENQKRLEKKLAESEKKSYQMTADARLKAKYPDLDQVASEDNLALLRQEDPDLYQSLLANPDPYSQWAAAYKAVKRYGIYKEDKYVADKQKALENAGKPRPLTSVTPQQGDSPLSKANAFANAPLTEDVKKKYWREMQEAMKRS